LGEAVATIEVSSTQAFYTMGPTFGYPRRAMTTPFDPIFVDEYALDRQADWNKLAMAGPPWHGALLKVSQGLNYNSGPWFPRNWAALRQAKLASGRTDFYRGAYHYIEIAQSGKAQAEYFLALVAAAGGIEADDLWPVVDVETANNGDPSEQQIVDCTTEYAETIKIETGRKVMLYGGSFLYDHGITSQMGCDYLWIARYTATLPANVYQRIGWPLEKLFGWQYRADTFHALLKTREGITYPDAAPGCGAVDLTVLTLPGGLEALQAQL
jgi:GH25 family lysozyme M1 (1,4-beta-N-acetylmuramidase)